MSDLSIGAFSQAILHIIVCNSLDSWASVVTSSVMVLMHL